MKKTSDIKSDHPLQVLLAQFRLKHLTLLQEMSQISQNTQTDNDFDVLEYRVLTAKAEIWKEAASAIEAALAPTPAD